MRGDEGLVTRLLPEVEGHVRVDEGEVVPTVSRDVVALQSRHVVADVVGTHRVQRGNLVPRGRRLPCGSGSDARASGVVHV